MSLPSSERLPARKVLSHLMVMAAVSVVLGVVVAGLAIPFAGLTATGSQRLAESMEDLPQELETNALPQRSLVLDANGNVLATLYRENRVNVPLRTVNRSMIKAILAIEDYRFYQHGALDLKGTLRALITNQANDGVVQGGSSITQQLVKLTLIQNAEGVEEQAAASADTYARKIRELRYAIALEEKHSKDWILERYLNTAYFGDGVHGIQMAAKHYFGVNASQLKPLQSALLAGLVKNPYGFDPTNFPDRALNRRNTVLDRMAQLNILSREKAERLKERGLKLKLQKFSAGCVSTAAPFFCDFVIDWLSKDQRLGKTPEERINLLETGGLMIKTTIDVGMQRTADRAVANNVFARDRAIGALAVVEPGTGEIKALAQSRPMGRNKKKGQTFINYVVPQKFGSSQCCQGGSTFKAFTLAAALEEGLPLTQTYNSPATMSFTPSDFASCPGSGQGGPDFDIKNSTSSGNMNMYSGTRLSVNTYFMQLTREIGICKPYEMAKSLGVDLTSPNGEGGVSPELVPSFTLGAAPVSPLEMAEAYATFAARGMHCTARPVSQILDSARNVIREYPSNCSQVIDESTADAVNDVLRGVLEGGGFAAAQALDQPSAGKTGTTSGSTAVWFVGYTPFLAAAAMIGGADQNGKPIGLEGQTIGGNYIFSASGSGFAAPIWGEAMRAYDDKTEFRDFVFPSGVPGAGVTSVPQPSSPPRGDNGGRGGRGPRGR